MASVRFSHLTRVYDGVPAVDDLSMEVEDGEFLVLVGPSGCGKSTTLRMLAGLEAITSGDVFIGDRRVNEVAARDRNIAMVFQSYALYPHMSVFENMAFALRMRKTPKDDITRRVNEAAAVLGIEELLKRKPGQLSGGQRQRVALGRAIVRNPAVFLLDEPLSNLDASLRVQTRAELSKLHERLGATFIYVTHDQVEAMTMATRIAVLDHGILQQLGTPTELYQHPVNRFVAGFIGSPAMNFAEMTIERQGDRLLLRRPGMSVPIATASQIGQALAGRQTVTLGIRPEHLYDARFVPTDTRTQPFQSEVFLTEMMGNETFLHVRDETAQLLARVDPRTDAKSGDHIELALDLEQIHCFDPETGLAIAEGEGVDTSAKVG